MFCRHCGTKMLASDVFCSRCGKLVHQSGAQRIADRAAQFASESQDRSHARRENVPAMQTEAGRAAMAKIKAELGQKKIRWYVASIISIVLGFVFAILDTNFGLPTFIGGIVFFFVGSWKGAFRKEHYYMIPGARDSRGGHRCIHCGNMGIYKHGEYKSSIKYADCSKCGTNLWME